MYIAVSRIARKIVYGWANSYIFSWIIKNQFGRRDLTPYQRAELALKVEPVIARKAEENRKATQLAGRNEDGTPKTSVLPKLARPNTPINTREEVAKLSGLSHGTLDKAKVIFEKAPEPLKKKVRSGEVLRKVMKSMSNERPDKLVKYADRKIAFHDVEFDIVDAYGEKWVLATQLAEALGYADTKKLRELIKRHRNEFVNKISRLKLSPLSLQENMVINYHGLIRVAMLSDAPRAIPFRDFAETVLFAVMTTGHYELPGFQQVQQAVDAKAIAEAVATAVAQTLPQAMTVAFQMMDKFMEQRTFAPTPTPLLPASGIPDVVSLVQFPQTTEAHPMTVEWERLHWVTATQWVRRNVPDRHIPSHFNMGKAFDNFVAKRHAETFNESPRIRKYPIELGNRSAEWVYPVGDETSRFIRQCFKEHISLKFPQQLPLPF